jgi:hypothetical protein
MSELAILFDRGEGAAGPDYPAAAGWYKRAFDAEVDEANRGSAANNHSSMYAVGRGRV